MKLTVKKMAAAQKNILSDLNIFSQQSTVLEATYCFVEYIALEKGLVYLDLLYAFVKKCGKT